MAYAGLFELASAIKDLAKRTKVPVVLHLDHGKTTKIVKECIKNGFTSVMFDGSFYDLAVNIKLTKKVVRLAHNKGISIEAELGRLGLSNRKVCSFTDPEEAEKFVRETGVDALAIAIGTSHGAYKFVGHPCLDLERIDLIKKQVSVPLVLHGASGILGNLVQKANHYGASLKQTVGVPDNLIKKSIKLGISKINIDTDLRLAFIARLREELSKDKSELDPRKFMKLAYHEMTKVVRQKIKLFSSYNKI